MSMKLVFSFLLTIVIGLIVAYFLSSYVFQKEFKSEIDRELEQQAYTLRSLYVQTSEKEFEPKIAELVARLHYQMAVYTPQGALLGEDNPLQQKIPFTRVQEVLQGKQVMFFIKPQLTVSRCVGVPLQIEGKTYALFISPDFERYLISLHKILRNTLIIVLIAGSIVFIAVAYYLVRPIRAMTQATKQYAKGDFSARIAVCQKDELGQLATSFNQMAHSLDQLEQMRQEFVSNVSHEIQSPLTTIRGFSQALQMEGIPREEQIEYLKMIQMESNRLSRLSEHLLRLSSLDRGRHPFYPVEIRLDEQLRQQILVLEPIWKEKQIEWDLVLPTLYIKGDMDLLQQVWQNLLHNAIKFSHQNGVIRLSIQEQEESIKINIQDFGSGITSVDLPRIFERFYIGDRARNREKSGSGIGLSIVQKIISLHHGQIEVKSTEGVGSTFIVTLPQNL